MVKASLCYTVFLSSRVLEKEKALISSCKACKATGGSNISMHGMTQM